MAKQVQKPIEYITPPNTLRAKLASKAPAVRNPLAAANKAMGTMADDCGKWVDDEINKLQKLRKAFASAPNDAETLSAITHTAMDVKGLAGPGGYPDADPFATSLIALLSAPGGLAARHVGLVEAHVDAIRATRDKTHSSKVAKALAAELANQTATLIEAAD